MQSTVHFSQRKPHTLGAGPIRIGDIISLRYTKLGGYMSVEGILVEDVFLDPSPRSFDDCLFKVHLQQQYSAARELEVRERLEWRSGWRAVS